MSKQLFLVVGNEKHLDIVVGKIFSAAVAKILWYARINLARKAQGFFVENSEISLKYIFLFEKAILS